MSTAQTALLGVRVVCERIYRLKPQTDPIGGRRFVGFARLALPQIGLIVNDVKIYESQTHRGETTRQLVFPGRPYEAMGQKLCVPTIEFRSPTARAEFIDAALRAIAQYEAAET